MLSFIQVSIDDVHKYFSRKTWKNHQIREHVYNCTRVSFSVNERTYVCMNENERTKELPRLHGTSKKHYAYKFLASSALFSAAAAISFHISGSFKSPLIHADHYHVRRDLYRNTKHTHARTNEQTNRMAVEQSAGMGGQKNGEKSNDTQRPKREKLKFNIILIFISHMELHMPLQKE